VTSTTAMRPTAMNNSGADTLVEVIALGSPSGHMSRRSLRAAQERVRQSLFGDWLERPVPEQPPEWVVLRREAATLRGLAEHGIKPRGFLGLLACWPPQATSPGPGDCACPFRKQAFRTGDDT
jgi:hypothetical protein